MEGLGKELLGEIESLDKLFKTEVDYHIKRLKRTFKKNQNHTKYKQTNKFTLLRLSGITNKKWNNENVQVNNEEILFSLTKSSVV